MAEKKMRRIEVTVHQRDEEIDVLHDEMHVMEREHNREVSKMKAELEHKMRDLVNRKSKEMTGTNASVNVTVTNTEHHIETKHHHIEKH